MQNRTQKFAYIVEVLRPYHIARLNHCVKSGMRPVAIELRPKGPISSHCIFPVKRLVSKVQPNTLLRHHIFAELEGLLARTNPASVVIPGWGFPEALIALRWARRAKRRTILLSDSNQFDKSRKWYLEWMKKKIVTLHDVALVAGDSHKIYIQKLGLGMDSIMTGYDVVDNNFFSVTSRASIKSSTSLKKKYELPDKYMLVCSRLIKKKNIGRILMAYSDLSFDDKDFDLVIVGEGELEDSLRQLAKELRIGDRVHFHGWVPYPDLPTYYAFSQCLIHVPLVEQWGLVLNEAAACGLPIISSETCGAALELVEDNANGFVVDSSDKAAIRAAMISMNRLSEAQRNAMKSRSREIVAHWDLDRFSKSLAKAIERSDKSESITLNAIESLFLSVTARLMGPGVS